MLDRFFRLSENKTNVRTELLAGLTTFLTMAYIIFVQPAVLSQGKDGPTGMDFGAVTTATCLSAALATAIMGLYARYPIAQAPGMGENFFFVLTVLPAAAVMLQSEAAQAGSLRQRSRLAGRPGRGVHFRRAVPAALDAGRARETDGRDQPQHAQRHRRRHRAVHRVHRPAATRG